MRASVVILGVSPIRPRPSVVRLVRGPDRKPPAADAGPVSMARQPRPAFTGTTVLWCTCAPVHLPPAMPASRWHGSSEPRRRAHGGGEDSREEVSLPPNWMGACAECVDRSSRHPALGSATMHATMVQLMTTVFEAIYRYTGLCSPPTPLLPKTPQLRAKAPGVLHPFPRPPC